MYRLVKDTAWLHSLLAYKSNAGVPFFLKFLFLLLLALNSCNGVNKEGKEKEVKEDTLSDTTKRITGDSTAQQDNQDIAASRTDSFFIAIKRDAGYMSGISTPC